MKYLPDPDAARALAQIQPRDPEARCGRCGEPMPATYRSRARQFCSRRCASLTNWERYNASRQEVDEMAVDRLIHGEPVTATYGERREAVAYLTAHGYTSADIARRLRTTQRSVHRIRATIRAKRKAA